MRIGDLSRRCGVSEHRLRAWERRYGLLKPRRSAGNYRLYSNADEARVRIMQRYLERGIPTAQAAELALGAQLGVSSGAADTVAEDEATRAREAMRAALDEFDETGAQRALEGLFSAFSATTVVRDILLPYLHELGERWAEGHVTVAQEHFASNFLHARLLALARGWDRGLGPRALLACPPGEQHTLPLICFGIALHQLGWRIVYLGADTPVTVVAQAAEHTSPELVVLAAAMSERLLDHVVELRELAQAWPLALAGAGAHPQLARDVGAQRMTGDPVTEARTIGV
jgi:DNA-binding transcriptional MerR regulator